MRILLMILMAVLPLLAFAQVDELVTLTKDGTVPKASSSVEAAREIQAETIAETARAQVIEILGEKRYQKNKGAVESKIIRNAAKFIPFVNVGQATQNPDGSWKMPVELKLSNSSLRKMILEAGLLNDAEGPASILPVVAFADRHKGLSLYWWMGSPKDDAHKFLSSVSHLFYEKIQAEFSRQGFHVIKPQETLASPLPEAYRSEHPSNADYVFMSEYFQTPMVLKGDVRFTESKSSPGVALGAVKLQVLQASSGRVVAEVSRQFETEAGVYENVLRNKLSTEIPEIGKDLATQVFEAWQRGTLNTNLIQLSVHGVLSPKQLGELKSALVQNVHEVKSIKERFFQAGEVDFEVDYTGESGGLAERLRALRLPAFDTKVSEATDRGLTLDVRAH